MSLKNKLNTRIPRTILSSRDRKFYVHLSVRMKKTVDDVSQHTLISSSVHGEFPAGPHRGHSLGGGDGGRGCSPCRVPQGLLQNAKETEAAHAGHVLCSM